MLCLDGNGSKGIIVGAVPHPDRKTNIKSNEPQLYAEYNGMRFEIQPDGYTPLHRHDWEHEVFILDGEGILVSGEKEFSFQTGDVVFIPSNELHQMKNTGSKTCKVICLIPYKEN